MKEQLTAASRDTSHFSVPFQHMDNASSISNETEDNFLSQKSANIQPQLKCLLFATKLPASTWLLCWEIALLNLHYLNTSMLDLCMTMEDYLSLTSVVTTVLWFGNLWNVFEMQSIGHITLSYQCDSNSETEQIDGR